ncbi:enolase [Stenotrophomonas maltophilia]|nr:enolase [Stenotrophomonas maltophilia]MBA0242148.1 enolase [Stenotrophomonas maltophilia]MBA0246555.1 enolase [Stenotrophomonas maltophilia]MBA0305952.1 enolase [Stenotrophomonas maltophilia]MBA0437581.1 enolase [Stenotrophomonas maltophilia]
MIHQTELRDLLPGMVPFPTDVFPADQAWLGQHLLPLLKIDLGLLRPELAGQLATMLCPIEPYEGLIGECTEAHHNDLTATNWIAFELTADNRMRFLGNEGYFQGNAIEDEDARAHIAEMRDSHAKARAFFQQHGKLASYSRYGDGEPGEQAWLDTLGGQISTGNWIETTDVPPAFALEFTAAADDWDAPEDTERAIITRDGRKFFAVAEVAGYNWCAAGADAIVMLYEPVSRTVLFSYDWS